ncbi:MULTISPECIES: DUF1993 family protein [unclassified Achromobacter]|uniref:DUF1993 domain-containing protein n=1 Tax=unclassified Achromobacter TaxID=2626865 RepID=UPI000B51B980|nr:MULTISPECIES: DUF1993 domain-containing protein [unclassified Achromobacter]OWT70227.1 hypothetical protein CEY05_26670 [Achromobacter sp. HZ34]OWT71767.1 hypothetical protein CEY04_25505 [Achromobacter sp. HZ28]
MPLFQVSIPVFLRGLNVLAELLRKGEAHAQEQGVPADQLLQAKLAPDMFNLVRQVQSASDAAKAGGARLAGLAVPSMADTETTFAELRERIAKTVQFLETVAEDDVNADMQRPIEIKTGRGTLKFTPVPYLTTFALPNFYFHVTTAYDILRNQGVPLGKMDYLGDLSFALQA